MLPPLLLPRSHLGPRVPWSAFPSSLIRQLAMLDLAGIHCGGHAVWSDLRIGPEPLLSNVSLALALLSVDIPMRSDSDSPLLAASFQARPFAVRHGQRPCPAVHHHPQLLLVSSLSCLLALLSETMSRLASTLSHSGSLLSAPIILAIYYFNIYNTSYLPFISNRVFE